MTHQMINGFITGIAVVFGGVIIAAILSGPGTSTQADSTPDTKAPMVGYQIPLGGVGGAPAGQTPDTSQLRTATGIVTDADSGEPLANVSVSADVDGTTRAATATGSNGQFELIGIPPNATMVFSRDGYRSVEQPASDGTDYTISLETSVLEGQVFALNGDPLQGATVASGDEFVRTDSSGRFTLEGTPGGDDVIAKAAGYRTKVIPHEEYASGLTLRPQSGYGAYASAETVASEERLSGILDMIDRTELNTLVVDIKDNTGAIHFDTQSDLAREVDAVQSTFDAERLVQRIKDRGIKAVARIAVFEDPALAEARPELAIKDSSTGEPWETAQGRAWVNPYSPEVRQYNADLIQEAIDLGFDGVHLSYVHFPVDGALKSADYGQESTVETRQQAINDFLGQAYEVSGPSPATLSADIFRTTLLNEVDARAGQDLVSMTERLDYVHPMLYPAHFPAGSFGLEQPNDNPYEVIRQSIERGLEHLPEHLTARIRPWLQDFSFGSGIRYSAVEVREQINAVEESDASGWLLWNSENYYHENALEAER